MKTDEPRCNQCRQPLMSDEETGPNGMCMECYGKGADRDRMRVWARDLAGPIFADGLNEVEVQYFIEEFLDDAVREMLSCWPLRESLAAYAHEAWAGWMRYLFRKSKKNEDGTVAIPAQLVERWTRQMTTTYRDLPEEERRSDRMESAKMTMLVRCIFARGTWHDGFEHDYAPSLNDVLRQLGYTHQRSETLNVTGYKHDIFSAGGNRVGTFSAGETWDWLRDRGLVDDEGRPIKRDVRDLTLEEEVAVETGDQEV